MTFPQRKLQSQWLYWEIILCMNEEILPVMEIKEGDIHPNSFCKATIILLPKPDKDINKDSTEMKITDQCLSLT